MRYKCKWSICQNEGFGTGEFSNLKNLQDFIVALKNQFGDDIWVKSWEEVVSA